jgi:RNA polymerase sigma-70 factor (ECF subfamily)
MQEQTLVEAVRGGSQDAFRVLVEDRQAELHAHCYRMLGSVHDADDALQETLLRAWRGLPRFAGRSSLRAWLYRIATNACMDTLARRRRRMLPRDYEQPSSPALPVGEPLVESVWIEPYPDQVLEPADGRAAPDARYEQREAVELAFIASLQHLPATQRAVLILRDVLGFSAREVSEALDTTVVSVNSALQRARRSIDDRLPDRSQQATVRALGDARIRELVDAYVDAWARADVDALRDLLAEDAEFSMPPWSAWWRGNETIAALAATAAGVCGPTRAVSTHVNGQPARAYYKVDPETGRWAASAIDAFAFDGPRIKAVTAFVAPEMFPRFGLAREL